MQKEMNLDSKYTTFIKIHSKWITDLNIKYETMTLLEDNIREKLDDSGFGNDYLNVTSQEREGTIGGDYLTNCIDV